MTHIAKTTGKPDKRMTKVRAPVSEGGRPEKPIDWDRVDTLLLAGCTASEVASHFDMHPTTFCNRVSDKYNVSFTVYSSEKKQTGESLLRAQQYAKALGTSKDGDNTLLIWLGKQRLNQSESPTQDKAQEDIAKNFDALMSQIRALQGGYNAIQEDETEEA